MTKMNGAKAVDESLKKQGVKVIFGIPGGATLPIYDVLYDSKIRHILAHHEQCAAHMADGYARAGGAPGVCLATSGPGATNLVTGIATAYMDSSPVIALTGQVTTIDDRKRRVPRGRHSWDHDSDNEVLFPGKGYIWDS